VCPTVGIRHEKCLKLQRSHRPKRGYDLESMLLLKLVAASMMRGFLKTLLERLGCPPLQSAVSVYGSGSAGSADAGSTKFRRQTVDPAPPKRCENFADLRTYLRARGNPEDEIDRCLQISARARLILEIGCGDGEVARRIAMRNPHVGILATDIYDASSERTSHYGRVARKWELRQLEAQKQPLSNLVLLRAEGDVLDRLPDASLDSALLIHPEPSVAADFFAGIACRGLKTRFKPGTDALVVKPFSREIGVMACGGFEFDHGNDWSQGLGFLIESPFVFQSSPPVHWSVDLSRSSLYARNSTQNQVFVCRDLSAPAYDCLTKARLVKNSELV